MQNSADKIKKQLSFKKILLPVLIGLLAAGYLLYTNLSKTFFVADTQGQYVWVDANANNKVDSDNLSEFTLANANTVETARYRKTQSLDLITEIKLNGTAWLWLFVALLCVAFRDLGYMYRIRILSNYALSWRQAFDSIMLWEFSSAITPSVVGGSGVAIYILNREGMPVGKSTAVVMITAMLDELFFIFMVPLVLITIGTSDLFPVELQKEVFGIVLNTKGIFWIGYGFIVLMTVAIVLSIFLFPKRLKLILLSIFKLKLLRKWRYKMIKVGDDLITTSKEIKGEGFAYWFKAAFATLVSWTARYWVVNFMLLAFTTVNGHLLIYARQLVMWVIMLISPTPGGSGIAELAFSGFLKEFTPVGLAAAMAILWRLFTYYPYLFAGALILPKWIKKTAGNN